MSALKKFYQELQALSPAANFRLDENADELYVEYGGYHFTLEISGNSYFYMYASVRQMGTVPGKEVWKDAKKEAKGVFSISPKGNKVLIQIKGGMTVKGTAQNTMDALQSMTEIFRAKGMEDSCENCGARENIGFYGVNGTVVHLCPDCFAQVTPGGQKAGTEYTEPDENIVGGIIGALIGSLLGVVVIIILGQLGYVAAIAGVAMGFGVLKGYEMLGKKLTVKGIIISSVIMIVMVWLAGKMDWALTMYRELKKEGIDMYSLGDCWKMIPEILKEIDSYGEYIGSQVMLYLFTALGAVPMMWAALKDQKKDHTPYRLG